MAITINGLETRFQKPKGGENPFKSAKPFDNNIDYSSLEDGDLFYIEQKERWEECTEEEKVEFEKHNEELLTKISEEL